MRRESTVKKKRQGRRAAAKQDSGSSDKALRAQCDAFAPSVCNFSHVS
jgi:hypothetical protein